MRSFQRVVFFLLLVLVLIRQIGRMENENPDGPVELAERLRHLGLQTKAPDQAGVISASSFLCGRPINVARIDLGFNDPRVEWLRGSGIELHYIYLGLVTPGPEPTAVMQRWALASVLATMGFRAAYAPTGIVLVAVPSECSGLAGLDWSSLSPWN